MSKAHEHQAPGPIGPAGAAAGCSGLRTGTISVVDEPATVLVF
jgi:hypothetical protein